MKKLLFYLCAFLMLAVMLQACGGAKSVVRVRNNADGTNTTISVSGFDGGTTSVSVTPDVQVSTDFGKNREE